MSKAGTFAAGRARAATGAVPVPTPLPVPQVNWGAPMYDLASRNVLQNADGTFRTIHPVDLKVRIALGCKLGSIPSAPTDGCAVSAARQTSQSAQQLIDDMNVATAALVSAGDISVTSMSVDESVPGRTVRYFNYTNLRLPGSQPQTVSAPV